jgi:hypothetical protein
MLENDYNTIKYSALMTASKTRSKVDLQKGMF